MFVIFGATGKVGQTTARTLRQAGLPVRAVVRDPAQAAGLKQLGCELIQADLLDSAAVATAIKGAYAVQMLCPMVPNHDPQATSTMRRMIATAATALAEHPPALVLGLSDYGAELDQGTGITLLFHELEQALKPVQSRLILLRSAEHLQNWSRMLPVALGTGVLPSLHSPVDRPFPTVSAHDVGLAAASLLQQDRSGHATRIISMEGPQRVSVQDVADTLADLLGKPVKPWAMPREEWAARLSGIGYSADNAQLLIDLYDTHNAGGIEAEAGSERLYGESPLRTVLAGLLAQASTPAR
ncbi:NmrA family NAD(P)-binding protein [Silvimonas iriomotensis]|uniref:NAD(P)-dependent oxidoreductase n=1 Tax=Silvimonas iriomotensis TaxID=449662 RepID=A0ABQ2P418_9NEIS|nr:NAD(P)H-binding protein [Silvimonas iriomotensis]GGP17708.1 NAD(P)-dependent oxidoreductase [Silvimonas iriomotensis]